MASGCAVLDPTYGMHEEQKKTDYAEKAARKEPRRVVLRCDTIATMTSCFARSLGAASIALLATTSVQAQQDNKITQAIAQLGSESPEARARARKIILDMGKPGLDVLRRAISAADEVPPEQLFVIAEDIGRERRLVRFSLSSNLGGKGWQIEWLPDGQRLGLLQRHGGNVRLFDTNLNPTDDQFAGDTAYFAFDPKDKTLAYNNTDGELVIRDRQTDRTVSLPVADKPRMAYSPNGRQLATGGYGRVATLWNVADGTEIEEFAVAGTEGALTPVFSPDGKLLVVGNRNDKTHVFDVASGEQLHVLDRRSSHQPVFSPDGSVLAIAYVDGKIGIWDPTNGKLIKLLDSETKEVFTLAWSSDGKFLASAGLSGPIVIWNGRHLAKLQTLEPGSERTFRLAFRPDSLMLAATGNKTTRTWTIESTR